MRRPSIHNGHGDDARCKHLALAGVRPGTGIGSSRVLCANQLLRRRRWHGQQLRWQVLQATTLWRQQCGSVQKAKHRQWHGGAGGQECISTHQTKRFCNDCRDWWCPGTGHQQPQKRWACTFCLACGFPMRCKIWWQQRRRSCLWRCAPLSAAASGGRCKQCECPTHSGLHAWPM